MTDSPALSGCFADAARWLRFQIGAAQRRPVAWMF
jgi:hypothetical protein